MSAAVIRTAQLADVMEARRGTPRLDSKRWRSKDIFFLLSCYRVVIGRGSCMVGDATVGVMHSADTHNPLTPRMTERGEREVIMDKIENSKGILLYIKRRQIKG